MSRKIKRRSKPFNHKPQVNNKPQEFKVAGTLYVAPGGFGFLRQPAANYLPTEKDVYVSPSQIRRFELRTGMVIEGTARTPKGAENRPALLQIHTINGHPADAAPKPVDFDQLTSLHPNERLRLAAGQQDLGLRVLDLVAPIGKGQRGLIVSPPRAGKTMLLQAVARAILENHPECMLFVLLIDERPEEVTDMQMSLSGPAVEVIASTFDRPAAEHVQVAEITLEKAKRLVETGRDVVILLDSLTRLARAYNTEASESGRLLTGGISVGALDAPKRFFGSARKVEEGGSLTILATALIDTGSRMDQVIFEEFKGTGNMEVYLDRRLVDRRVWPAININASGTRREELLLHPEELRLVQLMRRTLSPLDPVEAMTRLTDRLGKAATNEEFLWKLQQALAAETDSLAPAAMPRYQKVA